MVNEDRTGAGVASGSLWRRTYAIAALLMVVAVVCHFGYFWLDGAAWRGEPLAGRTHRVVMTLLESGGRELWTPCEPCGDGRLAFVPPVYTFFVAGAYLALGQSWPAMAAALSLVAGLLAALTYDVGRRLFGQWTGILAALAVTVYPYYLAQYRPHYETLLFALLLLAATRALLRLQQTDRRRHAVWAGVWLGLATLTRPDPVLVVPLAALWMVLYLGGTLRRRLGYVAAMLAVLVAVLIPWTARNWIVDGAASPFGSFAGMNRYKAYHPLLLDYYKGRGPFETQDVRLLGSDHVITIGPAWDREQAAAMPPEEAQVWSEQMPWVHWRAHPRDLLELEALKVIKLWSWEPEPLRYSGVKRLIYIAAYLPLLLLGVAGFVLFRDRWRSTSLFVALFVAFTGFAAATYGVTRYRVPIDVYLVIMAVAVVVRVVERPVAALWRRVRGHGRTTGAD